MVGEKGELNDKALVLITRTDKWEEQNGNSDGSDGSGGNGDGGPGEDFNGWPEWW